MKGHSESVSTDDNDEEKPGLEREQMRHARKDSVKCLHVEGGEKGEIKEKEGG